MKNPTSKVGLVIRVALRDTEVVGVRDRLSVTADGDNSTAVSPHLQDSPSFMLVPASRHVGSRQKRRVVRPIPALSHRHDNRTRDAEQSVYIAESSSANGKDEYRESCRSRESGGALSVNHNRRVI